MLVARDLDAILVTHPTNRRYLTGFTADDIPPDESSGHLIVSSEVAVLITGSVNVTQAEDQAPHIEVRKRDVSWAKDEADLIVAMGLHRIGYEPMAMLEGVFSAISEHLLEAGYRTAWVDAGDLVSTLRAIKSDAEIALLRRAFDITVTAFNQVSSSIKPGDTEEEIARKLEQTMVDLGAEGPSFPTIVAAGTNAARPHHEPGKTVIQEGEPIVIDMGAKFEGYCADLTRTIWVGEPDDRLNELYPIVENAVEVVFERLNPGVSGSEMDEFARTSIEEQGHGEAFSHGLGHGVGLRVHEAPSASKTSKDVMQPGNTITIEPGVYYPDWGGIRIEDVVLFTNDGYEILTKDAIKLHIE